MKNPIRKYYVYLGIDEEWMYAFRDFFVLFLKRETAEIHAHLCVYTDT